MAEKYYKDGTKWKVLRDANKSLIPDENSLKAGITIKIPTEAGR